MTKYDMTKEKYSLLIILIVAIVAVVGIIVLSDKDITPSVEKEDKFQNINSMSNLDLAGMSFEVLKETAQCKESDNGNDPNNAGVIAWRMKTIRIGTSWTRWLQSNDYYDKKKGKLREYYCGQDGKQQIAYTACDFGYDKNTMNYIEKVNGKLVPVDAYYCKLGPVCGNGIVEAGEECDDSNKIEDDGCNSQCKKQCMAKPTGKFKCTLKIVPDKPSENYYAQEYIEKNCEKTVVMNEEDKCTEYYCYDGIGCSPNLLDSLYDVPDPYIAAGRETQIEIKPSPLLLKKGVTDLKLTLNIKRVEGSLSVPYSPYSENITFEEFKIDQPNFITFKIPEVGLYQITHSWHYKVGTDYFYYETGNIQLETPVLPSFPKPALYELGNNNDVYDNKRINLVFMMGQGWENINEEERLKEFIPSLNSMLFNSNVCLFTIEPFKSNKELFNILYSKDIFPIDQNNKLVSLETIKTGEKTEIINQLGNYQKFRLGLDTTKKWIIIRIDRYPKGWSASNGHTCGPSDAIIIKYNLDKIDALLKNGFTYDEAFSKIGIGRVLLHETGHWLAKLGEEYAVDKLFNPKEFEEMHGYVINEDLLEHSTSYYSEFINPTTDCIKEGINFKCNAPQSAIDDCINNARWKDLLGNGCGKEGIIDCNENDPLHKLEVTCQYTNAGYPLIFLSADLMKPTKASIMSNTDDILDIILYVGEGNKITNEKVFGTYDSFESDTSIPHQGRLYGEVNERQICKYIKTYTGSAEGVCSQLCLDGCADGQKCISGVCT